MLRALRSREILEGGLVGLASPPDESRDRGGRDVSMETGMHRCVGFKRELRGAAERLHSRAASDSCGTTTATGPEGVASGGGEWQSSFCSPARVEGKRQRARDVSERSGGFCSSRSALRSSCVGVSFFFLAANWTCLPIRVFSQSGGWWLGLAVIDRGSVECGVLLSRRRPKQESRLRRRDGLTML